MLSSIENSFSFALDATKLSVVFANMFVPSSWSAPNHCHLSHLHGTVPTTHLRAGDGSDNDKELIAGYYFLTKVAELNS